MNWQQAQKELITRLDPLYGSRESTVIADWVMEHLSGKKKLDRLAHKTEFLTPGAQQQLEQYTAELLQHRPIQYVLHESWFFRLKFYVDENVLIPRPETEELVEWVIAETASLPAPVTILDIGTGSGCIAVSLKSRLPAATVHACDISPGALAVAQRNATTHHTAIDFHLLDFLDEHKWQHLPDVRIIVSNPPYIPVKEKGSMAPHVVEFEPHQALFVNNDDPLLFYRTMIQFASHHLLPDGALFAEIHEDLAAGVKELFLNAGYQSIIISKDMQGKDRMIKATR